MSKETIDQILFWSTTLVVVFAIIWLLLWAYGAYRRKNLNITRTETVRQDGARPDFLTVDQEKREAALRGGETFDQHVANRDAPPEEPPEPGDNLAIWRRLVRLFTLVLSLATVVTGTITAMARVEEYDEAVRKYGIWENIEFVVKQYPLGFAVATIVIIVIGYNFVRSLRSDA